MAEGSEANMGVKKALGLCTKGIGDATQNSQLSSVEAGLLADEATNLWRKGHGGRRRADNVCGCLACQLLYLLARRCPRRRAEKRQKAVTAPDRVAYPLNKRNAYTLQIMIHDGRPNAGGARGSDPCEKTPLLGATLLISSPSTASRW